MLEQLAVAFEVQPADVEEATVGEPRLVAEANARMKALAVPAADGIVIGADTIVAVDGDLLGKPRDAEQARDYVGRLAGRAHEVVGGLAVVRGEDVRTGVAVTRVTFRAVTGAFLDRYVTTGEWRERAGGYAIQGQGAALVERVEGDYANVVGLPVALLLTLVPDLLERPV